MSFNPKFKILIIYRFLPEYRKDFYNGLRKNLQKKNIQFDLFYGKSTNQDVLRQNEIDISWAQHIPNTVVKLASTELYWQPCLHKVKNYDLIVVEQANKLLINYYLMFMRKFKKTKMAFWGHGVTFQDDPNSLANRFKSLFVNQCDWWFAYTKNVKKIVKESGFPDEKITVVQNAIDTKKLVDVYGQINHTKLSKVKYELGLNDGPVGIFCGGMYKEKKIDFLLDACDQVKKEIPDFHVIFIGDGPDSFKVSKTAKTKKWMHYIGPKFDEDRVIYFKLSDVFLMPGLVGLAILDSFAMQTPIITTNYPFHSPEIEYLENEKNGLLVNQDVQDYANAVVKVLREKSLLEKLRKGGKKSAEQYTLDKMVANMADGIQRCLVE